MKLKLSATDLDSWIWYNRIESMTSEELINRLKRLEPPNEQMMMGTALHSIFEDPPPRRASSVGGWDTIEREGYLFRFECDCEVKLPQVREIKARKTFEINGVEVTLTGKCDGVTGNKITDHKLTFRPNPENYFSSYQWKAYLDIFNADVFEYIIYHGSAKGNEISVRDVSHMKMYRYPEMEDDLKVGVSELLQFIKTNAGELIKHEG